MKSNHLTLASLIAKFLTIYCNKQRNLSENTILSYRDTFKNYILFLRTKGKLTKGYGLDQFNRTSVSEYMMWLQGKGNSPSTINQRLSAIKSFCEYAQYEVLEQAGELQNIMAIKPMKGSTIEIGYLTVEQTSLLINRPDSQTISGLRHRVILSTLYDTAARVSELCNMKTDDLYMDGENPYVKLEGKGSKERYVPITASLSSLLRGYIKKYHLDLPTYIDNQYLFFNRKHMKLSTDGIQYIIDKYAKELHSENPSFPEHIHPHMFRHSKAMHMLAAGINIVYIRDFLGHAEIETTMCYARADKTAKEKAINKLAPKLIEETDFPDWNADSDLLNFLNDLA